MKNIYSKVISAVLVFAVLFNSVPAFSIAVGAVSEIIYKGTCGDNLTWELDNDGTLTISGTGDMYDYDLYPFLPGTIGNEYSDSPWYDLFDQINKIIIDDCVTSIGDNAFYENVYFTDIIIGNSVTSIGESAFSGCEALESINIPNSVTSIGKLAFSGCEALKNVIIPNSINRIESGTFWACGSLESVTIPHSVTSISASAFMLCDSLSDVYFLGTEEQKNSVIEGSITYQSGLYYVTWHYSEEHNYDNSCDSVCNICGYIRTAPHTYSNYCDTDCNNCGFVRIAPHIYDNSCDKVCNECGYERIITHTYDNSCDQICNFCGYKRITVHTYDNTCDTICNICGFVRKTSHKYVSSIVLPTATEEGYTIHTCSVCGESYKDSFVPSAKVSELIERKGEILRNTYLKTAVQKKNGSKPTDDEYELRLISMLDCLEDYKEIGFLITIAGYNDGVDDEPIRYSTDTVYTSFLNGGAKVKASDYGAKYFSIVNITMPNELYSASMKIQPYIVFTDGTEFLGNEVTTAVSKYIK